LYKNVRGPLFGRAAPHFFGNERVDRFFRDHPGHARLAGERARWQHPFQTGPFSMQGNTVNGAAAGEDAVRVLMANEREVMKNTTVSSTSSLACSTSNKIRTGNPFFESLHVH